MIKIRSDILRIQQSIHIWVGITAGMLLFIGFFAGALTMFKQPLERWISPPLKNVIAVDAAQANNIQLNPEQLDKAVHDLLVEHPAARKQFTLHLIQQENIPAPITWSETESHGLDLSGKHWHATLDRDGKLYAAATAPTMLAELIDMLHRTAGIPGTVGGEYIGVYILGIAGVMYFLALVSGVVLLLPTLAKDFLALRTGKNNKRFWLDAHNIIGIASLPYHIVISLTVIVFAFHDFFYDALADVVYREQPMFSRPAQKITTPYSTTALLPASELIHHIQQTAPDFVVRELLFMDLETTHPRVRAAVNSTRYILQGPQSAYVIIQPYTGELLDTSMLPTHADSWSSITTTFFALHFGTYGGDMMRWVYFFMGIGGAFLFYSGNLLWLESRRKKQRQHALSVTQARNTRLMASATVCICLGSIIGVCASMVAGKWLFFSVKNINSTYLLVYYSVFLAAVAWAFWHGAARASIHLLWFCSVACAAIPLTSTLAVLIPATNVWANSSAATIAVDVTALVAAVLFAYAAQITSHRVNQGAADSVWSAKTFGQERHVHE